VAAALWACWAAAAGAAGPPPDSPVADARPRIVGGTPAGGGAFAGTAALVARAAPNAYEGLTCAGTLIDPTWVLTAAHCVVSDPPGAQVAAPDTFDVVLGRTVLSQSQVGERIPVTAILVHPGFDPLAGVRSGWDGALLKLAYPSAQPPTAIATGDGVQAGRYRSFIGTPNVAGWGATTGGPRVPGPRPDALLQAYVAILPDTACAASALPFDGRTMTCAASSAGVDTCAGDSGGPLLVFDAATAAPVLWGMTSFGTSSCASGEPTRYAWVPALAPFVTRAVGLPRQAAAAAGSAPATPSAPGLPGPPAAATGNTVRDTTAPRLTRLRVTPTRFAALRRGAAVAVRRGARLRWSLDGSATVTLAFARRACRRAERRCARHRPLGTVTVIGRSGPQTVRLTGRLRGRALPRGSYRLTLTARDAAGNRSAPRSLAFRVTRG